MPVYLLVVRTPEILSQGNRNGKFFNLFMRITVFKSSRTGQHTHTHIGIDVNTHYVEMYALAYVHAYTHTQTTKNTMYNGIESSRQSH